MHIHPIFWWPWGGNARLTVKRFGFCLDTGPSLAGILSTFPVHFEYSFPDLYKCDHWTRSALRSLPAPCFCWISKHMIWFSSSFCIPCPRLSVDLCLTDRTGLQTPGFGVQSPQPMPVPYLPFCWLVSLAILTWLTEWFTASRQISPAWLSSRPCLQHTLLPGKPSPVSPITALVQNTAHSPWSPFHAGSCLPFVEPLPCAKPSAWQISYLMPQEQILQGVGLPVPILHGIELSLIGYEVCWRSHG